jgi:hypothetical protein
LMSRTTTKWMDSYPCCGPWNPLEMTNFRNFLKRPSEKDYACAVG